MKRNAKKPKADAAKHEQRLARIAGYLLSGLSYREIVMELEGTKLKASIHTVYKDTQELMKRWREEQSRAVEEFRDLELKRLDAALKPIFALVLAGDINAIGAMLKIMDRRARYLGLDAPTKTDLTSNGQSLGPLLEKLISALENAGMKPSDVFAEMLREVAYVASAAAPDADRP